MNIKDETKDYTKKTPDEDIEEIKELEEGKEKKKNLKKYFLYLIIILLITGVVIYLNLRDTVVIDGVSYKIYELVPRTLQTMNVKAFLIFIGVVILAFLINAGILFLFAKLYQRHYKYHQALACHSFGEFFSAITPGASGGQVAQVYLMKKQGILVSNGASIFVMSYICYQIVLVIVGVISVCTSMNLINSIPAIPLDIQINGQQLNIPISVFIIAGFVLNVLVIVMLFFMALSSKFQHFVVHSVMGFLAKIHLIKNVEKKRESIRIQVENFRIEFKRLQTNIGFTTLLIFLNVVLIILKDMYPLLAGACLNGFDGVENINWFKKIYDCIVLSNFHQMATGLIPLPGSAGVSEFVFERLFGATSGFFPSANFYDHGGSQMVLLFWRFITFYIPFLINGIVTATYKTRGLHSKDGIFVPPADRKTMLTIQFETIEERKENVSEPISLIDKERKKIKNKINDKENSRIEKEEKKE